MDDDVHTPTRLPFAGATTRLRRARWGLRRRVLVRRRWLAALLAGLAVLAAVRAVAPPATSVVDVPVAARDLPAGTVLEADDLTMVALPRGSPPDGVVADAARATGRTLAAPVRRGETLTDVRFVGPGLLEAHPDLAAVPIRLPDAGMAALVRAGDRIDVLATDPQGGEAAVVARDALVLALPEAPSEASSTDPAGRLVVLGVPEVAVTRLVETSVTMFLSVAFSG